MATSKRLPCWLVVILFGAMLAALSWSIVRFDLRESLLFPGMVAVVLLAFYYERRIYISALILAVAASVWVTSLVSANFTSSLFTIAGAALSALVLAEAVQALTAEQALAHAKLQRQEEQYRLLFQNLAEGCALHEIILDENGQPCDYRFLRVNSAFEQLTGLKADAVVGRTLLEVMPGTDPSWIARYGHVTVSGEPIRFEDYSPEQQRHYAVTAYRPEPGHFAVVFHDVTERKHSEAKLREVQTLLEQTGHMARVGGWEKNLLTGDLYWSEVTRAIHEVPDDFVPTTDAGIAFYKQGENRDKILRALTEACEQGTPFDIESQIVTAKGNERWVRIRGQPELREGRCVRLYGMIQDIDAWVTSQRALAQYRDHLENLVELEITARTQAQEARRESESRLRAISNAANVLIISSDMSGIIQYFNPYTCQTLGYRAEDVVGRPGWFLLEDGMSDAALDFLARARNGANFQVEGLELVLLKQDGQSIATSWNVTMVRNTEGKAAGILAVGQDITTRRQLEQELAQHRHQLEELVSIRTTELRESQMLLDMFFAQSLDGFFFMMLDEPIRWDDTVDKDSVLDYVVAHQRITRINDAMLAQFGATREQYLGITPQEIFSTDLARGRALWCNLLDTGHLHVDMAECRVDGTPIWIEGDYVCIYDSEGRISGHFGVQREVSEQRRMVAEIKEREHFLAILSDITHAALETPDLPTMLQTLADQMSELFEADGCYITLWDDDTQATIPAAASGPLRESYRELPTVPGEVTMTESVLRAGHILVAEDVYDTPYLSRHIADAFPTRSMMALPLVEGERKLGAVLVGYNRPHRFTGEERQRAEQASRHIALAVAKAQLYQELQAYASQLAERVRIRTAELQAQYARLDAILRSVDEAIFMTDSEHRIRYVNPAFTRQTGYTTSEALGRTIETLNTLETLTPSLPAILRSMVPGKLWQEDTRLRRKDGRRYEIALTIAPVYDDRKRVTGHVFTHRDISRARDLERARNQFIANVSHQFRTPVTTLKLSVYLMQRIAQLPEQHRYLSMMEANITWLSQLIEDTLELSALDSRQAMTVWEPIFLPRVVEAVVRRFQDRCQGSGLTLAILPTPSSLPCARGDEVKLGKALTELLENAVAFTPVDGLVRVAVNSQVREASRWLTITVQDTGPGIPEDEKSRVFERFFRGSLAESGHTAGTGLGLSIAQQIVQAHGGHITVESTIGQGSTFTLWLPPVAEEDYAEDHCKEGSHVKI
jgi:PAS domain S-box-containing protein